MGWGISARAELSGTTYVAVNKTVRADAALSLRDEGAADAEVSLGGALGPDGF